MLHFRFVSCCIYERASYNLPVVDCLPPQNKAVEFSKLQICVDLFLFSAQYTDVATLSNLPKFTAGQLFYYQVRKEDLLSLLDCGCFDRVATRRGVPRRARSSP